VDGEAESAVVAVKLIAGAEVVVEAAEVLTAVALAAGVNETVTTFDNNTEKKFNGIEISKAAMTALYY
jgi:hypothetical protein